MNFEPAISGWLWGAVAAVPVGILALYFLRLRRQPMVVPSTLLWRKSIEDLRVNAFWQRLRKNTLLALQMLVAGVALLALARPTGQVSRSGEPFIVMLDQSASMSATDGGDGTRLSAAKRIAHALVDQLRPDDAVMVLAFSDTARVIGSYTTNHKEVHRAIDAVMATQRRTNPMEALQIASGLANPRQSRDEEAAGVRTPTVTVHLISDGRFPPVGDFSRGSLDIKFHAVGRSNDNVGVVTASARPSENNPSQQRLLVRIRNFSPSTKTFPLELYVNDKIRDVVRAELAGNEDRAFAFRVATEASAVLEARLAIEDDFPADNRAWLTLRKPTPAPCWVVSDRNNPILKSALSTDAMGELVAVRYLSQEQYASALRTESAPAVVLFDGSAPAELPSCNTWHVGVLPVTIVKDKTTQVRAPVIVNWDTSHPVLKLLALEDLTISQATVLTEPKGIIRLIDSDRGPVLFVQPRGPFVDLVQAFAWIDADGKWGSDWPLKLSFPLYVYNAFRFLTGNHQEATLPRPGDSLFLSTIDARLGRGKVEVKAPSGKQAPISVNPRGQSTLETDEIGVYTAKLGEATVPFAVNLFDENESDIGPAASVSIGAEPTEKSTAIQTVRADWWRWLALACLTLLAVEWIVYHRRLVA